MNRFLSFAVLIILLVAALLMFWQVMSVFLVPIIAAILCGIVFEPVHARILAAIGRPRIAALLTTLVVLASVLVPIGIVLAAAAMESATWVVKLQSGVDGTSVQEFLEARQLYEPSASQLKELDETLHALQEDAAPGEKQLYLFDRALRITTTLSDDLEGDSREAIDELSSTLREAKSENSLDRTELLVEANEQFDELETQIYGSGYHAAIKKMVNPHPEKFRKFASQGMGKVSEYIPGATEATLTFVVKLVVGAAILIICVYYYYADGPYFFRNLLKYVPLEQNDAVELSREFSRVSRAVVVATFLSAFVQGILAAIGFFFAGVEAVFLLLLLTVVCAIIPFVGAAAVWVPVSLWLIFIEQRYGAGLGLAAYGALVVSLSDNVIKPLVLHGQSKLHPLLALLGILGGVQAMGPIGIFIGPMIIVMIRSLVILIQRDFAIIQRAVNHWNGGHSAAEEDANKAKTDDDSPPDSPQLEPKPST